MSNMRKNMVSAPVPAPKKTEPYTVYGISTCPYCQRAKSMVEDIPGAKYYDITNNRHVLKPIMVKRKYLPANYNTVPMVFKKGKFIGGYSEMSDVSI